MCGLTQRTLTGNVSDNYSKRTKKHARLLYNTYINDMVDDGSINSRTLYSFIISNTCDSYGVSPLRNDGFLHSSPKAEILNNQFPSVFNQKDYMRIILRACIKHKCHHPTIDQSPLHRFVESS